MNHHFVYSNVVELRYFVSSLWLEFSKCFGSLQFNETYPIETEYLTAYSSQRQDSETRCRLIYINGELKTTTTTSMV